MSTTQNYETFVPVYDAIPNKWEDAQAYLTETLKKISNAINVREVGFFLADQQISGKNFIPVGSSQQFRTVFRNVIDFGALPASTTKSVAHGITVDSNFTLISLWAAATKPTSAYASLQIPFSSPTLNENIKITLDATNINITTAIDYSAYTRCFVVAEYLLEV